MFGSSVTVPITKGRLALGTWWVQFKGVGVGNPTGFETKGLALVVERCAVCKAEGLSVAGSDTLIRMGILVAAADLKAHRSQLLRIAWPEATSLGT
jgi:hypothetical protein